MLEDDKKRYFDELLSGTLKQEPAYSLPENFADVMAEKAGRRFAWEQYLQEFLIYLGAFAGIIVVLVAMSLIFFQPDWKSWYNFLLSNIWLVAGVSFLAVFILFADRVLLRYFLHRSEIKRDLLGHI